MDEFFARCKLGVSRISRCCHLISDLFFYLEDRKSGQAFYAVTGTRAWALGSLDSVPSIDLLLYAAATSARRLELWKGS